MAKKFINFIFKGKESGKAHKDESVFPLEKDKKTVSRKDRNVKDREVSEIISSHFGRALERLGER